MKKMILLGGVLFLLCANIVFADDAHQNNGLSTDDIQEPTIDIVFVIDTTGSMSDEIREVQMHIKTLIEEIQGGTPKPNVTIGFVLYRDYPDQEFRYISKHLVLTSDIDTVLQFIENIVAGGGGDYEETVTVGLDIAINDMNWRPLVSTDTEEQIIIGYDDHQNPIYSSSNTSTKRMIILIGDAPPRTTSYVDPDGEIYTPVSYTTIIEDAKQKHIAIYTISGSGMDEIGVSIWKELAEQTNGEYEPLVYERKNIQEYVYEEGLDGTWVERAKGDSDYRSSDNTISSNNLGEFVCHAVQNEAKALGVSFNNEKTSSPSIRYLKTIGYLIDDDGDGIYTLFNSNQTGANTTINRCADGTYLIESTGDTCWDYVYNPANGQISSYKKIDTFSDFYPSTAILIVGGCITLFWFIRKQYY